MKQKFGDLRFFAWPKVPLTESLIDAAREKSAITCEIGEEPGVLRWQNGVQTICDVQALLGSRIGTAEEKQR